MRVVLPVNVVRSSLQVQPAQKDTGRRCR